MSNEIVPVPPTAIVPSDDRPTPAPPKNSNPLPAPTGQVTFGARNYNSKVGIPIDGITPPKFDGIFKAMPAWMDSIAEWVGSDGPQRVVYVELCVTDYTVNRNSSPCKVTLPHTSDMDGVDGSPERDETCWSGVISPAGRIPAEDSSIGGHYGFGVSGILARGGFQGPLSTLNFNIPHLMPAYGTSGGTFDVDFYLCSSPNPDSDGAIRYAHTRIGVTENQYGHGSCSGNLSGAVPDGAPCYFVMHNTAGQGLLLYRIEFS